MQRRNFLSSAPVGSVAAVFEEEAREETSYHLLRFRRAAMASTFEIAIPYGTCNAIPAATDALNLIDELEDQLTVYRDTSEISNLNTVASRESVTVEKQLFELLQFSSYLTNETQGAFDVCSGSLVRAWGFLRREGRVPTVEARTQALAQSGTRHLLLDAQNHSVKYLVPGLEINLAAIGKGYALDRAAERLKNRWKISSALLHVGGSSAYAIGHPPGDPRGWPVDIRHPWDTEKKLGTVRITDQGFGTSAATVQHFVYNGKKLGHLLDPRLGWPAQGTDSASVSAPTAAEADAISTAFYILGATASEHYARSRPHLSGVILQEGSETPVAFGLLNLSS